MTIFFRQLALTDLGVLHDTASAPEVLRCACYDPEQVEQDYSGRLHRWLSAYSRRLQDNGIDHVTRTALMSSVNPEYVLRNYLAHMAIEQTESGDTSLVYELLELLRKPYREQPEKEQFYRKRPGWARHKAGCSMPS